MCFPSQKGCGLQRREWDPCSPGDPSSLQPHPAGMGGKQSWFSSPAHVGLCCSSGPQLQPSSPVTHTPCSPALPGLQFPPEGRRRDTDSTQNCFIHTLGASSTTTIGNPATSSASQTLSLAWQSPELGELLFQAHRNNFTTDTEPVTAKGQTQALQILSNIKPNSLAVRLQFKSMSNL